MILGDFTSISEKLSSQNLSMTLNFYMGKMTDIIFEYQGTLDKYIGDAIVSFWGAPLPLPNHPTKALQAAVKMIEELPNINRYLKNEGFPEFDVGIGINTGECSVGNMGSSQIFAYTALGDHMNLGARLESLCKYYGAKILISEFTYQKIDPSLFTLRLIDQVKVKGKENSIAVYEVFHSYHFYIKNQEPLSLFKDAYQKYLNKDFKTAIEILEQVLIIYSKDKPAELLLERAKYFLKNGSTNDEHIVKTMKNK